MLGGGTDFHFYITKSVDLHKMVKVSRSHNVMLLAAPAAPVPRPAASSRRQGQGLKLRRLLDNGDPVLSLDFRLRPFDHAPRPSLFFLSSQGCQEPTAAFTAA